MKFLSVIGARPQFIKVKPIIEEVSKHKIHHILLHTGQHYDYEMTKIIFEELEIPEPDYNLNVGSHSHGKQTGMMLERIEKVLMKEKPDVVIVYGDTNSTLAGAVASVKLEIPVAHIEAGLRSFNKKMPEEINRILTDRISDFLFCPSEVAVENLKKEGIEKGVFFVGDIMYDIFLKYREKLEEEKVLKKFGLTPSGYILLTIHRKENTDNPENLKKILESVGESKELTIFPLHPRTKKVILEKEIKIPENIRVIKPVSYLEMLVLEKNSKKILTDSGGVQKEAYWFGIPCITLREETEWIETVKENMNILTGSDKKKILNSIKNFSPENKVKNIYGYGNTAEKIIEILVKKC